MEGENCNEREQKSELEREAKKGVVVAYVQMTFMKV